MNAPDEMSIDVPTRDGTLLRLTLRRDEDGLFSDDSPVDVQEHRGYGFRPLYGYYVSGFRHAAQWTPGRTAQLQLHDQEPGLIIESHWLTAVVEWLSMAASTDASTWKKAE